MALLGRAKEGRAQIAELLVASDSGGDLRDEGEGEPPVIYRVETLDSCVARVNLLLSPNPTAGVAGGVLGGRAGLHRNQSRFRASVGFRGSLVGLDKGISGYDASRTAAC